MARPIKYIENKYCKTCNEILNFKKFRKVKPLTKGPNKGKFVGWTDTEGNKRFSTCLNCEKDRFYKRYRSNPIPQLIYNYKKRAKLSGVPFDLKPEDVKNRLNSAGIKCPALGVKMEISKLGSKNNDLSPSIDRIDPKKGYVRDNIVVVSMKANRIKTDATIEEIRKVANFYEKLLKK